ncbi:inclusion membrane protein GarD [Chlamydia sp. 17-3921]|uniref:inclusion membrane protein GarD n=1 Tax=Chlamydia sp. 17-3921 TaxID=2675798 RepID=UPI0019182302|nr:hypothetical protein [Chlamydia sp. 17-3921]
MPLSTTVIQSNETTLQSIRILCSPSQANLIITSPENRRVTDFLTPFLENRKNLDLRLLRSLAETTNTISPRAEGTSETLLVSASFSLMDSLENVIGMLGWISLLCQPIRGENRGSTIIISILLGIIGVILSAILGTSIGIVASAAVKIKKAGECIRHQKTRSREIQRKLRNSTTTPLARATAVTALQASSLTISAYKNFRASSIHFLIIGIIATIALITLIAGIVMAIFFCGPAATTIISSAMIGCCAAGASVLGMTTIGFIIATFHSYRKRAQIALTVQRALLHTAISERLLQHPDRYYQCELSKIILERCLNSCCQLFSTEDRAALGLSRNLYNRAPFIWGTPPVPPPPTYEEVVGNNGHIYNFPHEGGASQPPPPYSRRDPRN